MKRKMGTGILILLFLVGLSLVLYPTVSDWWNSMHQSRAISSYTQALENGDAALYEQIRASAQDYNRELPREDSRFEMTEEEKSVYMQELNLTGNGIMGVLEIPGLDVEMPIYHTTEESVLQVAVGHIEGSSLPVGGVGTHCALSGHRGLPSARLFTDLDKMDIGDVFTMRILNETLTYQVDQVLIVLPHEVEALAIEEEKDYCTLVTCTPYGVNSHRLLVRGVRIETLEEKAPVAVMADAFRIDPMIVAPVIAAPILLVLVIVVAVYNPKKKEK